MTKHGGMFENVWIKDLATVKYNEEDDNPTMQPKVHA